MEKVYYKKWGIALMLLFFFGSQFVFGQSKALFPGKVVVNGDVKTYRVFQEIRNRTTQVMNAMVKNGEILIPMMLCKGYSLLEVDDQFSWIRIKPNETVEVKVSGDLWEFSGANREENQFLYACSREMVLKHPNALWRIIKRKFDVPAGKFKAENLYSPEYVNRIKSVEDGLLNELAKTDLKDEQVVQEVKDWIHYTWLELQILNYKQACSEGYQVPHEALSPLFSERFERASVLQYPNKESLLVDYFKMMYDYSYFEGHSAEVLARQAARIEDQQVKEWYVVNELNFLLSRSLLYQMDQVIKAVEPLVMTVEGKENLQKCKGEYEKLKTLPVNRVDQSAFPFEMETVEGKSLKLSDFKGKYLLIDVWTTTCGLCIKEFPALKKLKKELQGKNIEFLAVSMDELEKKETWRKMSEQYDLGENSVISPNADDYGIFPFYGIQGIPHYLLISPEGKVIMTKSRLPSDAILKTQLLELLSD